MPKPFVSLTVALLSRGVEEKLVETAEAPKPKVEKATKK